MRTVSAPPSPALLEAMRSVGYTVEAAVADVIDNSVAADAESVEILISPEGAPQLAILDDGRGMARHEAIRAMTLAPNRPTTPRMPSDLGRFGLGLKTASLSQCRTLTVVSKQGGRSTALRWSLDYLIETGEWSLIELDPEDLPTLLGWKDLQDRANGTLIHWGDLDLLQMTEGATQDDFDQVARRVRDHVALVFHRFSGTDGVRKIGFYMNGAKIAPVDPFMTDSKLTIASPWESIRVEDQEIRLVSYTVPYLSKLPPSGRSRALALGGLRETQGFYVYRANRLVIWGTWFRVIPRSEMAKLTRVRVDIPNSLDHLWALDVKKSHAEPPPLVRRRLSELARTMILPSQRVQAFRGRRPSQFTGIDYVWAPRVNGDEFRYEINTEHQSVSSFAESLSPEQQREFTLLLEDIQTTFPIEDAHYRMSADKVPEPLSPETILERALQAWDAVKGRGIDLGSFLYAISQSEPYCLVENFDQEMKRLAL